MKRRDIERAGRDPHPRVASTQRSLGQIHTDNNPGRFCRANMKSTSRIGATARQLRPIRLQVPISNLKQPSHRTPTLPSTPSNKTDLTYPPTTPPDDDWQELSTAVM